MNATRTLRATTAAGRGSARRWRYISAAWPQTGTVMASRRAASTGVGIARTRLRTVAPPEGSKGSALAAAAAATLAAASAAAAALNSFGGGSTSVPGCSSADGVDDPYEPGQAVGVGIKAEMWKTKHPNLTILETMEDSPVLVRLLTFLRRSQPNSKRQHFRRTSAYLQGVYSLLASYGSVRATRNVNNCTAYFWQGVLPEDDVNVCAISLYLENEPCGVFDMELDAAFPSFERGSLRVRGLTRGSSRELPRDMQGKQILLLAPVVGYAQPVLAALERLEQAGVEDDNVTLVSVVISKDALETLTEEVEDMRVVSV
ncbi:unnamed protein product [Ectocarpus sp. 13 AM-2016]